METLKKNFVFIATVIVIIGGVLYWYISLNAPSVEEGGFAEASPEFESQYEENRQRILRTIDVLQGIHLDIAVFDDPQFRALTRIPRPDVKVEVSRPNPFYPLDTRVAAKPAR